LGVPDLQGGGLLGQDGHHHFASAAPDDHQGTCDAGHTSLELEKRPAMRQDKCVCGEGGGQCGVKKKEMSETRAEEWVGLNRGLSLQPETEQKTITMFIVAHNNICLERVHWKYGPQSNTTLLFLLLFSFEDEIFFFIILALRNIM